MEVYHYLNQNNEIDLNSHGTPYFLETEKKRAYYFHACGSHDVQ
jgi:hypothetical protein